MHFCVPLLWDYQTAAIGHFFKAEQKSTFIRLHKRLQIVWLLKCIVFDLPIFVLPLVIYTEYMGGMALDNRHFLFLLWGGRSYFLAQHDVVMYCYHAPYLSLFFSWLCCRIISSCCHRDKACCGYFKRRNTAHQCNVTPTLRLSDVII